MSVTAGQAWSALASVIVTYEVLAADGQLLSEGVTAARARHWSFNVAIVGGVLVTAAHLLDGLPKRVDPFTQALRIIR